MKNLLRAVVALAVLVVLPSLFFTVPEVCAQSDTASLSGAVVDQTEAVIPNVQITLLNSATSAKREVVTSQDGTFSIPLLPPGTYKLIAQRKGFAGVEIPNIVLHASDQRVLNIKLKIGQASQMMKIEASVVALDTSPSVSTSVDRNFVNNLPLNGRSFQSLLLMTPGVVMANGDGQLSINGQRTDANYFTVDGVSANIGVTINPPVTMTGQGNYSPDEKMSGSIPGFNATGTTNNLISVDAMQEFKVQTNTYSAEYGRQPGGQVQLTSRSGSNKFHGDVYDYFRNDALDAQDWFNASTLKKKPPLRQNDFGATLGGPIYKDKTFFFASYEGLRLVTPQQGQNFTVPGQNIYVPGQGIVPFRGNTSLSPVVQAMINAFPAPNGPDNMTQVTDPNNPTGPKLTVPNGSAIYYAQWSNIRNIDAFSVRIDHHFNSKISMFGRINISPSSSVQRGVATDTSSQVNTKTYTFGTTALLTNRMSNEFHVNYSENGGNSISMATSRFGGKPFDASTVLPSFADKNSVLSYSLPGYASYSLGPNVQNRMRQWNFTDNYSILAGSHSLKFGMDYRYLFPKSAPKDYLLNIYLTDPATLFAGKASTVYTYAYDSVVAIYKNLSLYSQDTWRVNKRLTLDMGLRWEWNPAPVSGDSKLPITTVTGANNLATMQVAPPGTPMYRTVWNSFAPRIGASYELRNQAGWETVLRGGFGIFYDLGAGTSGTATTQFPFSRNRSTYGVAFPFTSSSAVQPPAPLSMNPPFYNQSFTGYNPDFVLPRTYEWTVGVSQGLGANQTLTVNYVGNAGRRLIRRYVYQYGGGFGSGPTINPSFIGDTLSYSTNAPGFADSSDYDALQVQFQRRLSKGIQVLSNYTWAHAMDTGSNDFSASFFQNAPNPASTRGNSDFDIRQIFNAAVTYQLPSLHSSNAAANILSKTFLNGWSTDFIFKKQTAAPVTVSYQALGNGFNFWGYRADQVPGVPVWVSDPLGGGGKRLNSAAFTVPACAYDSTTACNGNTARNGIRGFGATQLDFAISRDFPITERVKFEFRGELFNIFNHPNFGSPSASLGTVSGSKANNSWSFFPTSDYKNQGFGRPSTTLANGFYGAGGTLASMYSIGGPRSVQLVAKIVF